MPKIRLFAIAWVPLLSFAAIAQPSPQPRTPRERPPLAVPHPHYVTLSVSVVVNAPVDAVWAKVGGFCSITEWMNSPQFADCTYLQGNGDVGSVRSIVSEVMVGKTQYSYTYAQPPHVNAPWNMAHSTLAAEALTPTTTKLSYTSMRDDSVMPDEAARKQDMDSRRASFEGWLKNMKTLAEGGTLPPKPAGTLRPPNPDPFLNPNPHYAVVPLSIVVNAPIDTVWARIGKTCDIGEWGFESCEIVSGKPGELGLIRTIGDSVIVAQGKYSYTYAQPLRTGGAYNMYHGTVEARPLGTDKTTLYYTLLYDDSRQPDDAARTRQATSFANLFGKMLRNMKKLAEGGTLTDEDKQSPSLR